MKHLDRQEVAVWMMVLAILGMILCLVAGCGDKKPNKPPVTHGTIKCKVHIPSYRGIHKIRIPTGEDSNGETTYTKITIPETHPEKFKIVFTYLDEEEGEYYEREVYVTKERFHEAEEGKFFTLHKAEAEQ